MEASNSFYEMGTFSNITHYLINKNRFDITVLKIDTRKTFFPRKFRQNHL